MTSTNRPTPATTLSRSRGGSRSPSTVPMRPPASTVSRLSRVPVNHIGWLVCEEMQIPPSEQLRFWAHELGGMAKTGLLHAHDSYDQDRCERILAIAGSMAAR